MRNYLFAAAAAVALLAGATSASATGDYYGVQVNAATSQVGTANVGAVNVGDNLSLNTAAVGNNVSVETTTPASPLNPSATSFGRTVGDARVASVQVNYATSQTATANLTGVNVGGDLSSDTQAIGNIIDVSSEHNYVSNGYITPNSVFDKSISLQANVNTSQVATTNLNGVSVGDDLDLSSVAVGSNASFFGAKGVAALSGQLNLNTQQIATTNVLFANVTDNGAITSQAIGNASSFIGDTVDPINLQGNLNATQIATSNIGLSSFGGNLSVNTSAIGNTASVANVRVN